MSSQNPVIVIPGITASRLVDRYDVSPTTVWSALDRDYARVALHPDDLRYERAGPARVEPDHVFTLPYRELIEDLRHDLSPAPGRPTPVFPFAYDWRRPLACTESRLADFVSEVIDRTALLRHYDDAWRAEPRVDLVGHSMGGLIIAGYLARAGTRARVGKVVSIGAPFRGSFEAALKITTGLAELGQESQSAGERDAARLTPALYHLLPDFPGSLEVPGGLPGTLFDARLWQPSVIASIAATIDADARDTRDPTVRARAVFESLLREARDHRDTISRLKLADAGLGESDCLCIAGVDARTRVHLRVGLRDGEPEFDLDTSGRRNDYRDEEPSLRAQTGDGTVPFHGALPAFLDPCRIVCVTPDDFGYWELGERSLRRVAGFHGMLPKMNLINRLCAAFLTGLPRRGTWGRPAPDVADADWVPPVPGMAIKPPRRLEIA